MTDDDTDADADTTETDDSDDGQSENTTLVVCRTCGYHWDYGGELQRATCPACGHKTPVDGDTDTDTDSETNHYVPGRVPLGDDAFELLFQFGYVDAGGAHRRITFTDHDDRGTERWVETRDTAADEWRGVGAEAVSDVTLSVERPDSYDDETPDPDDTPSFEGQVLFKGDY